MYKNTGKIAAELLEIQSLENRNTSTEKKFLKKEFKFSMAQPENWDMQKGYPDPFEARSVYSMIESSTFEVAQPIIILVIIDDT